MAEDGDASHGQEEARKQEEQEVRTRESRAIVEEWLARAQNPATGLEANLKKAEEKIKQLEHKMKEDKKITDIIKQEHVIQIETQENVIMMMATEIKNLQEGRESQLSDGKEKALTEALKKLTAAESERKELVKKLEETAKDNDELTKTANTLKKVVESVGNNIDEKKMNKTKKKIMCRNIIKTEGCKWGDKCKFSHEEGGLVKKTECAFWLDGHCRFSENDCWNNHNPSMKGSKSIESNESQIASQSDFQIGQGGTRLPPGLVIQETSASRVDVQGWEKPMSRKTKKKMRATAQEESQLSASLGQEEQTCLPTMDGAASPICHKVGETNNRTPTSPMAGELALNPQQMLLLTLQALLQQAGGSL